MSRLAREVQRSRLHSGKITEEEYRALRKPIDVDERDDSIKSIISMKAKLLYKRIDFWGPESPMGFHLRNLRDNLFLREVIYHPTKGYRTRQGEHA